MPVFTTACPRNCYSTCSMRVIVRDGRLRMIEPVPENRATTEGVCLKGLSYIERVYSEDRILYPLRKQSDQSFYRVTWDEALNTISEHLQEIRLNDDPQSILYYSASGTKGLLNRVGMNFWRLYGGCTTTYGDLCWPAGLEATRLTLGENKHNSPWDLSNAQLIIMWGKNAAETNIHQMVFVEEAIRNGARLVVIDPRRTQTSERAAILIQPQPGSDGALALGLAHLLIRNDHIDHVFIKKHVHGYQSFAELAEKYPPERVSELCDIPVSQISTLAELIGSVRPVTINAGFGMQRYTNSGQTMRAIIALLAITGNIGKTGAGWIFANLQSHIFDPVKDPIAFYPPVSSSGDPVRVSISTTRLGEDIIQTTNPPIRMIWVERGNPVTQNPNTNRIREAFRSREFVVVVDQFMTDTAREADLILPAKTMFEQSDVIGAYWHPYMQLKQKIIDPPGEVKPESEIYRLLAEHLQIDHPHLNDLIPGPSDDDVESFLNRHLLPFPGLTLDKLREGPVLAPGLQDIAFSDLRFPTPSGRIELYSTEASERWGQDALPAFHIPDESRIGSDHTSSKYPLYFMTPNTKNRIHSQFNNLKLIRQFSERPLAYMHPEDAESRGITHGDRVIIFNDRGELGIEAALDFSIRKGCVAVSNGWWISEGGTVNFLSSHRETDMGYGAAFHDNLVEIRKI